jgi:hypothetical protein
VRQTSSMRIFSRVEEELCLLDGFVFMEFRWMNDHRTLKKSSSDINGNYRALTIWVEFAYL